MSCTQSLPSSASQRAGNRLPEAQRGSLPGHTWQKTHLHLHLGCPLLDDQHCEAVKARANSTSKFGHQRTQSVGRQTHDWWIQAVFTSLCMFMHAHLGTKLLPRTEGKCSHVTIKILPGSGQDMDICSSRWLLPSSWTLDILIKSDICRSPLFGGRVPAGQHG